MRPSLVDTPPRTSVACAALLLAGRQLGWEHPIEYAAADGSCATAELQAIEAAGGLRGAGADPDGCSSTWQAAYACATPAGGGPWKRLRQS